MTAEPDGGSTGADHHADDDDSDPGSVDDLPDVPNHMVIVHGAPLPVVPFATLDVPLRMISVPSAARLKARRRGYLLLVLAVNAIPGMLLTCDFRWSG